MPGGTADEEHGDSSYFCGKRHRTTIPDRKAPCPLDKVNRQFRVPVPNMLRVSDFCQSARKPDQGNRLNEWRIPRLR